MAGIAGYFGTPVSHFETSAVKQSLSFTGKETAVALDEPGFWGIAVGHAVQALRCPQAFQDDTVTILIDGYITGIAGSTFDTSRPGNTLSLCAGFFRLEGPEFARRLNGSYSMVVIDHTTRTLHLICDRLGSRHLYYMNTRGGISFSSRIEALQAMGLNPMRKINPEAFVEFMVFSKLLATHMWEGVVPLHAGTYLSFHQGRYNTRTYWEMEFAPESNTSSLEENARRFAETIRYAVERNTAGFDHIALLLSGGLDSRMLLSCLPKDCVCYAVCDRNNLETRIASRAAKEKDCQLILIYRSPSHYMEILPRAARVTEGCYEYNQTHFENLYTHMHEAHNGVVLTGHFFNRLIRGGDLPDSIVRFAGRNIAFPKLRRNCPKRDFASLLMSFPEVQKEAALVLAPSLRRDFDAHLENILNLLTEELLSSGASAAQLLELYGFMQARSSGTSAFLLSLQQNLNERYIAMDNEVIDLLLSIPPEQRFSSRLFKRALSILDPRLSLLVDASTLLPATAGPWLSELKPFKRVYDRAIIHIGRRTRYRQVPVWTISSGSWPNMMLYWRYGPLANHLDNLLTDEAALHDEVIDPGAVRRLVQGHRNGVYFSTMVLNRLLTFLTWRASNP